MNTFPEGIKFKYPWRKYQQRVLDDLNRHLIDEHLHIIAPPGSGKTVLGLEVVLRLGQPSLILPPTITIRNQWIQRFCELFLQTEDMPEWVSKDIRNPKFMTVVTYQALHAVCNNLKIEEEDEINNDLNIGTKENDSNVSCRNLDTMVKSLKSRDVSTIVVDGYEKFLVPSTKIQIVCGKMHLWDTILHYIGRTR